MASSFDGQDFHAMDTSDQSPIEQYASIGQRVSELKRMVTLVGSNLLRCDPSKPAPQALPSCTPMFLISVIIVILLKFFFWDCGDETG